MGAGKKTACRKNRGGQKEESMSVRRKLSKHKHERLLREAEFELFQRRVWKEVREMQRRNIRYEPLKGLVSRKLAGEVPVKPTPTIQCNKAGGTNV
jgi:hypothetical protein